MSYINVQVDNAIRFRLTPELKQEHPQLMARLRADLVVDNPEFVRAKQKGRSTFRIPSRLTFYEFNLQTLEMALPRGYQRRFVGHLQDCNVGASFTNRQAEGDRVQYSSAIELRDYQIPAVEAAMDAQGGVIEAPCGAGKTQMGLEIVARHGQKAVWLTHTLDLAHQVIERAGQCLGLKGDQIGLYGNGQRIIGTHLTVALIPTLAQPGCEFPFDEFGLVLVDETHHAPAAKLWAPVINKFPAVHRYGVTATLERADGLEIATHLYVGPTVYRVPAEAVRDAGGTLTPRLVVHFTKTESASWAAYEEACKKAKETGKMKPEFRNYGGMLTELFADAERNNLIVSLLATDGPGHYSLVLSDRVAHCQLLQEMLKKRAPQLKSSVIHGGLNKAERTQILDDMRAGKIQVLFSVDIAKEGLDLPILDREYLVAGGRNESELTQKVGRVMRPAPGKSDAVVVDLVDGEIGILKAQYYARRRVYKQLGMIA